MLTSFPEIVDKSSLLTHEWLNGVSDRLRSELRRSHHRRPNLEAWPLGDAPLIGDGSRPQLQQQADTSRGTSLRYATQGFGPGTICFGCGPYFACSGSVHGGWRSIPRIRICASEKRMVSSTRVHRPRQMIAHYGNIVLFVAPSRTVLTTTEHCIHRLKIRRRQRTEESLAECDKVVREENIT